MVGRVIPSHSSQSLDLNTVRRCWVQKDEKSYPEVPNQYSYLYAFPWEGEWVRPTINYYIIHPSASLSQDSIAIKRDMEASS